MLPSFAAPPDQDVPLNSRQRLEKIWQKTTKRHRKRQPFKRYAKDILGERVQMDACKIDTGIYQYTAIDDCSRFRVMHTYKRRTAKNSVNSLVRIIEQMPFPIQTIQTDRGKEFFGVAFLEEVKRYSIKFRPIKPRSPHLNGKVERSHQTDLQEFYIAADLNAPQLNDRLKEWQFHYNWFRYHSSLQGTTPVDIISEKSSITPWNDVIDKYDPDSEPILKQNYRWARKLGQLKRKRKPAKCDSPMPLIIPKVLCLRKRI